MDNYLLAMIITQREARYPSWDLHESIILLLVRECCGDSIVPSIYSWTRKVYSVEEFQEPTPTPTHLRLEKGMNTLMYNMLAF